MKKLLVGSQSASRKWLLEGARVPFRIVEQHANERACSWDVPLEELVLYLARLKMEHVIMPADLQDDVQYVLTADTVTQGKDRILHGKPSSLSDAQETIRALRGEELRVGTGFRIEKRQRRGDVWETVDSREGVAIGTCVFSVPEASLENYFQFVPALSCSGSMGIEAYGMQFVQQVSGSYSAILGLPLYECCENLRDIGFSW